MSNIENIQNISNNNEMIAKGFIPAESSGCDDFTAFLTKSADSQFNGALTMSDLTTIFPKVFQHNVLRQYCLCVATDSSYVEIPCTSDVIISTNTSSNSQQVSAPIRIHLSDEYAKWLIPRSLFNKVYGYPNYLKNIFADHIAALERQLFISGKTGSFDGIISLLNNNNAVKKVSLSHSTPTVEELLTLIFSLKDRYRKDAIFMMSSETLRNISSLKDKNDRLIFDGVEKIFGHKIEVIDELGGTILFSDFKQSTVIAERYNFKIEMHSSFDDPSKVGLSLPISVGIGIINYDAIVYGVSAAASIQTTS